MSEAGLTERKGRRLLVNERCHRGLVLPFATSSSRKKNVIVLDRVLLLLSFLLFFSIPGIASWCSFAVDAMEMLRHKQRVGIGIVHASYFFSLRVHLISRGMQFFSKSSPPWGLLP